MSAGTSEFFCLICLLVCSCRAARIFIQGYDGPNNNNINIIGITAEVGQDVILPCKAPNDVFNLFPLVKLIRPGLEPECVFFNEQKLLNPHNQHESYQNRVNLQDKHVKGGNASMILKDVMKNDTGRYECHVYQTETNNRRRYSWKTETIINLEVYAQTNITAELGQDVILPCKVPNNINNNITAVEWIRPDQEPDHVLFYRDGRSVPHNQHPSYQNRMDLKDKDMKDGNFSLVLKNVTKNDTGRYECRVYEEGKNEPISIIYLEVHGEFLYEEGRNEASRTTISNFLDVVEPGDQDGIIRDGEDKNGGDIDGNIQSLLVVILVALASVGVLICRSLDDP